MAQLAQSANQLTQATEPTLESVINSIRESRDRIAGAANSTADQIIRLGFCQPSPVTMPELANASNLPGRERTAMERLIELADQLQTAATDCEWNHKHLQKQF